MCIQSSYTIVYHHTLDMDAYPTVLSLSATLFYNRKRSFHDNYELQIIINASTFRNFSLLFILFLQPYNNGTHHPVGDASMHPEERKSGCIYPLYHSVRMDAYPTVLSFSVTLFYNRKRSFPDNYELRIIINASAFQNLQVKKYHPPLRKLFDSTEDK